MTAPLSVSTRETCSFVCGTYNAGFLSRPMGKGKTKEFWWTAEKVQKMGELYNDEGCSLQEIADHYKIKKQRVSQLFKKFGVERRKTKSKAIAEKRFIRLKLIPREILIDLYCDRHLKIQEIFRLLKTNEFIFYKSLKFHKIPK